MSLQAPYGTWESPLGAADTVEGAIQFSSLVFDGIDLYWIEGRPSEGGRQVLVRRDSHGSIADLIPTSANARTRVHEYGGAPMSAGNGRVVWSEFSTQRLHELRHGNSVAITPEPSRPAAERYADGRFLSDGRMVCVRETHPEQGEAVNELVTVDLATGQTTAIAGGRDFYAAPRPDAAEDRIAWLEWDHPNMPWDGTTLKVGTLSGNEIIEVTEVAGGPEESVLDPQWAPDGSLVFISDRTGYWNLYRWNGAGVVPVLNQDNDFANPAWIFGRSAFGFLSGGRILTGFWEDGSHHLAIIGPDGSMVRLTDDLSIHDFITTDRNHTAWFIGAGPQTPSGLFQIDTDTGETTVLKANPLPVAPEYTYRPRPITFPTGDGEVSHAVFYPPANPDYTAPEGEQPPLIVQVHGGPTSHVYPTVSSNYLYWTTRGFAVVDVNYRGSTAYGREYRNRLQGNWGLVDVEDCLAAARYLADHGEVDENRLVITGGSAGGFTTLAALAFGDAFSAGASYYGVADLELLAKHTHKFESSYLSGLASTDPEVLRKRSPLYSADQIDVPVILFQGLEDRVVPPEQAEMIATALKVRGVPHAHVVYEGEDHGFRQAKNIVHSLETELAFYGRVFGFVPAGDLPALNLAGQDG
ncbi:MAG: S9 family peptidase [Actinomycetota bacterium]|nr:S9 family peptidase [Actinomycetota bacterium]